MVALWLGAQAALAAPERGLMWNRTGLPLTFPLILQTRAGADHFVTLHPEDGGGPVLAAYFTGGTFSKVLVPPGTWQVRIASGRNWQGLDELFGTSTEVTRLAEPLTFEIRGVGTRRGHVIDLRGAPPGTLARSRIGPAAICSGLRLTDIDPDGIHPAPVGPLIAGGGQLRYDVAKVPCR